MKKLLAVVLFIFVIAIVFILRMGMPKGPKLEQVAHLKAPQILTMPDEKVLVVIAKGSPDKTAKKAFGVLMSAYFKIKDAPKGGKDFKAPRARWAFGLDTPKDQWVGYYAMPVPPSVTALPEIKEKDDLKAELAVWKYGEVAQVLYVGSYDKETPTINDLLDFIGKNGYEISGMHEEEYLRGPGAIFTGNPETYLTLIRYPVKKKEAPPSKVPAKSAPAKKALKKMGPILGTPPSKVPAKSEPAKKAPGKMVPILGAPPQG